jgi:hypothetical protein
MMHRRSVDAINLSTFQLSISTCIRRLFWFGHAAGVIEKNAQHIFFKEAKAAPLQGAQPAGCGGKASIL